MQTAALRFVNRVTGCPRGCQGSGIQNSGGGSAKVVVTATRINSRSFVISSSFTTTTAGRSLVKPFRSSIQAKTIRPYRRGEEERTRDQSLVGTNGTSVSSNHDCGGGFFFANLSSSALDSFRVGRFAEREGFFLVRIVVAILQLWVGLSRGSNGNAKKATPTQPANPSPPPSSRA